MLLVRPLIFAATITLALAAGSRPVRGEDAPRPNGDTAIEFFEKKIRPLLADNCYSCHSADTNSKGGLRVDDRNGLVYGGENGAAILPGNAAESLLIRAVSYTNDDLKMPPNKQLSAEQVADLTRWINEGAAWPRVELPEGLGESNPTYDALRKQHWAWQPLRVANLPEVRDRLWARSDIDTFILAKLEAESLQPVGDADRLTLIRRLTFDLTGLPPTAEETARFLGDTSPEALSTLVDRLLASPAFGERWGRHWLDVARYGESTGSSRNLPLPHAWRFRDYVIDAVNHDKPYDQFIREQIAGDLLPATSQDQRDEQLVATGFLALGVKDVNQRFKVRFVMDNIDEQIDTVSRAVLALTASCARCHDHKFDPIPTADYYALAGIFQSTDLCAGLRNKMGGGGLDYYDSQLLLQLGGVDTAHAADSAQKAEEIRKQLAEARAEFEALRGKPEGNEPSPDGRPKRAVARQKVTRLQNELIALTDPAAQGARVAFGVRDAKTILDTEIRVRGEAEKLGPVVKRGFLSVVPGGQAVSLPANQSGRLELARWLTSPQNPLTSRVMVNRIWHHLFGRGLVSSVDNFGITGDVPSHPELLDHLATQFVRDGWSVKRIVRAIVLSRAYGLSAATTAENTERDPGNRFVWRHRPRRLDAEEIRDATLAAAGKLDLSRPTASPAKELKVVELNNSGPDARRLQKVAEESQHRSVYLPLLRGITPSALEVFDFAEQGMVTGSRDATTVATQALYLLNAPFVRRQSLALAEQLLSQANVDELTRVTLAYRTALGRTPTSQELSRAVAYLADYERASRDVQVATAKQAIPTQLAAVDSSGDASAAPATATSAPPAKKPKPPQNPDEVVQTDEPVAEDTIQAATPQAAAWASFCQALLGSAEFRYLK